MKHINQKKKTTASLLKATVNQWTNELKYLPKKKNLKGQKVNNEGTNPTFFGHKFQIPGTASDNMHSLCLLLWYILPFLQEFKRVHIISLPIFPEKQPWEIG